MHVIVDGVIFQRQSHGGISRIYSEILPRMCIMDEGLRVEILTTNLVKQSLPTHSHICHRSLFPIEFFLRPGRLWRPVSSQIRVKLQRWAVRNEQGMIWNSTYYTRLKGWAGKEVVTVVDMIHERYPDFFNRSNDIAFKKQKRDCVLNADAILCISATTQQDLHDFYGIDLAKTYVVPLAHSPVFRKMNAKNLFDALPTDKPFLLYVGQRCHYKNFDIVLMGYGMWSHRKDVDLVVVGKPWIEREEHILAKLNVADNVHLLTDISDEKLAQLYNQALAFVCPSLYEGFGIPLLEAMACGCPVVASRIPSTIEVAGKVPLYFEPTEVESLLTALSAAYSEGRDLQRVKLGLEHVKQYSWDRTAKQILEIYRALSNVE